MARPATAPPIARAVSLPAKPIPTRRTAAPARLKKSGPIEQFRFQDLTAETPSEKTSPQNEAKKSDYDSCKKRKGKNDYAPLVWSLAAVGTVILVGAGIALVMFALKTDDPKTKKANKSNSKVDKQLNTNRPEKKAPEVVTGGSEKKQKPANSALKKDKSTSPATNKKPDLEGKPSKDSDEPIPIPGLEDPPEKDKKG
jgi:cytoskeletal protein RodZ